MNTSSKTRSGFTLIELVVVVGIIGLLAAAISLSLGGQRTRAREVRRISDMETISNALQQYVALGNTVPQTAPGYFTATEDPTLNVLVTSGVLSKVPAEQSPQGTSLRCQHYSYSAPNYDTQSLTDGAGNTVGKRDYELSFHSELATSVQSVHPLNGNLLTFINKDADCQYYSAFLFAPMQQ